MADEKTALFFLLVAGDFSDPGSGLGLPPSVPAHDGSAAAWAAVASRAGAAAKGFG
jgi:hypothetical protein